MSDIWMGDYPTGRELSRGSSDRRLWSDTNGVATPERVKTARRYFTEEPGDFQVRRRVWVNREMGEEFKVVSSDALADRDPRSSGVSHFVVLADRLVFLRPRGQTGRIERERMGERPAGHVAPARASVRLPAGLRVH